MSTPGSDLQSLSRPHAVRPPGGGIPPPGRKWKSRVLLPAGLLGAFALLLLIAAQDALWPALDVQVIPVVVKSVQDEGGRGGMVFQAPGWVEADPYLINVTALADGIVKEVLVLEGSPVQAGQVVARLVDDDAKLALANAEALVAQREAELVSARATLTAAEREWKHPVERTRSLAVAMAQVAQTQANLAQAKADVAVETARLAELEEQFKRELTLTRDALPEFTVIQTELRVATQRALVQSAQAKVPAMSAELQRMEAERDAAKENLELRIPEARMVEESKAAVARSEATLLEARAKLDEAKLRLERMNVRCPTDGVVMRRLAEPGSKLMLGMDSMHSAHALHVYDPTHLQVRVDVPLAEAGKVSVGQKAEIVVEVLPDRIFTGEISRVVHEADIQKNTLQVKVRIEVPDAALKPEMLARVKFLTLPQAGKRGDGPRIFAPARLLIPDGAQTYAWVVDKGRGVAERRNVTPGVIRYDDWIEIAAGLLPGDQLIVGNPSGLHDGTRVHVSGEAETGASPFAPASPAPQEKGKSHASH
ncbi:MAG: efflux RND transporter periplasmic adaptor subunit [Planctomycetes bacterium]|nr:efflux RND transporter periplasmic adaptor subunit [Planctomycetota bacterium]